MISYETAIVSYEIEIISYEIAVVSYETVIISYETVIISYETEIFSYEIEAISHAIRPGVSVFVDRSRDTLASRGKDLDKGVTIAAGAFSDHRNGSKITHIDNDRGPLCTFLQSFKGGTVLAY